MAIPMPVSLPREQQLNSRFTVRAARAITAWYVRGYHRVTHKTPCTLPKEGPAILVCNHISGLDPVVLQSTTPRLITWMMAREYYDLRALKWFYDAIEAIPVERSGRDMPAVRSALRALRDGRVLGIFPEGRIAPPGQVLPFQTGVALLAFKSGAPVYPAYLDGTARDTGMGEAFLYSHRLSLAFGPEVRLQRGESSRELLEAATTNIRDAVVRLRDQYGC